MTAEEAKAVESLNLKGAKEAIERLKHNEWIKANLPSRDPKNENFRRLAYVRYVDDFILGFTGTKVEAETIKSKIEEYLNDKLLLKINQSKSFISRFSDRGIKYLGFYVRYLPKNKIIKDPKFYPEDTAGIG